VGPHILRTLFFCLTAALFDVVRGGEDASHAEHWLLLLLTLLLLLLLLLLLPSTAEVPPLVGEVAHPHSSQRPLAALLAPGNGLDGPTDEE